MKYLRPENIRDYTSRSFEIVRALVGSVDLRSSIALILVFSQAAYGMGQNQAGTQPGCAPGDTSPSCTAVQNLPAAAPSQNQGSVQPQNPASPSPQNPASLPQPQSPVILLEDGRAMTPTPTNVPNRTAKQLTTREKKVELTDFQQLVQTSLGQVLPIYGESLFENVPTTFAPVDHIPVTADYVIGPGDELMIRAWGQIDLDVHARVDRNGNVFLPKVGSVGVAGLRYAQLEDFLKSHIGRIYQNFDLNVTMGELRSIDIYVVGQVTRPGRYTVSSLSTLTNAIFASGGPSPHGSMRDVQLKRGGKVVTTFDLYDLLLNGDKSKDALLQPEDVIYVAPNGPQVALGGQVNVPGIYELKTETKLSDAIRLSGGLTNTAAGGSVYIEHIVDRRVHRVEESPKFENSVTLRGNVAQPGRYPWRTGMRISDLIPNRGSLYPATMSALSSVELASQAINSQSVKVWAVTESSASRRKAAPLRMFMMTLTKGIGD